MTQIGLETWRGAVRPAQIDQMGHMNVRHYLAIAMESLAGLAAGLDMPLAFTAGATATLLVREHHVRFLAEARVGAPLHMTGAVLQMGEADALLLQVLFHSRTGQPAAAIRTRVEHVTPAVLRPFPWPKSARARAEALAVAAPDYAEPRGIPEPSGPASLARAEALAMPLVARGAALPSECDIFGRVTPDHWLARIGGGISHFADPTADILAQSDPEAAARLGGAAVELRMRYHAVARPGDQLAVRAGLVATTPKSRRTTHWVLDPASGQPWVTADLVAVFFDLQARRAMPMPEAVLQKLNAQVIAELAG